MARQVAWAEVAWADLESAADFIARDSAIYAAAFAQEVRDAARSLSEFALRGRVVPEFKDPGIRELVVGAYRLIYMVTDQHVHILGLIHGARDLRALWEREERGRQGGRP